MQVSGKLEMDSKTTSYSCENCDVKNHEVKSEFCPVKDFSIFFKTKSIPF